MPSYASLAYVAPGHPSQITLTAVAPGSAGTMVNFWVVPYYSPGFTLKATLSETTYTDIDFFNDFSGTTGDWYIVVQLAADVDGNPTISTVSDVLAITASVAGAQATAALSPGASGGDLFYGGSTDTPQPFAFPPPNPPPGPGPVGNIAC